MKAGKKPNYMVAIEPAKPAPAKPAAHQETTAAGLPGKFREYDEVTTLRFRDGYAIRSLSGETLKEMPGYQLAKAKGEIHVKEAEHYTWYLSDYSFDQMKAGKKPNVMVPLGEPHNVIEGGSVCGGDLLAFDRFANWATYRQSLEVELKLARNGEELYSTIYGADGSALKWFEAIGAGLIPKEEALECLKELRTVLKDEDWSQGFDLMLGIAGAKQDDPAETGEAASPGDEDTFNAMFFENKSLYLAGLTALSRGDLDGARRHFTERKRRLVEILDFYRKHEGDMADGPTNTGDNTIPNTFGCSIYIGSLCKKQVPDADVDIWIENHLRRSVAERLGLSSIGGENNFNIEDYSNFDFRNMLAVMRDPGQVARLLLSAKGTTQQFQLASGAKELVLDGAAVGATSEVKPLEVLKRFGIEPWTDQHYQRIDHGVVCIDYLRIRNLNPWLPHQSSYLCVAYGRQGVIRVWHVRELAGVERRIQDLIQMASQPHKAGGNFESAYAAESRWFLDTFIQPGLQNQKNVKRLMICPDGPLHFVPFGALLTAEGRFLIEDYPVVRMPAVRLLCQPQLPLGEGRRTALLLGAAHFDDEAPLREILPAAPGKRFVSRFAITFGPLPGTKREVDHLSAQMGKLGWATDILAESAATEPNLVRQCRRPTVLHLASHAYYLPEWEQGKLAFGAVKLGGDYSSGLALCGANTTVKAWAKGRQPSSRIDGILTAEEMARLDLNGCQLAVLSACETALGKALDGEGVQGLTLACAVAGARNQITTLWPVDDNATVEVMTAFYEHFLGGKGAAEALRLSQIKRLNDWRRTKSLATALEWGAPFVCTTSEPFESVSGLAPESRQARLAIPKLAEGQSGYAATADRLCKVWLPAGLSGKTALWEPDYNNRPGHDAGLFATGQGSLYLLSDGQFELRVSGTMTRGKFEGQVRVEGNGKARNEIWRDGALVP